MPRRFVAAVVVAALGMAGGVVGSGWRVGAGAQVPTMKSSARATTSVDKVIAKVETFVSRTRGLAFKRKVPVTLLTDRPFRARLLQDVEKDRADIVVAGRVLRAVGLIGKNVDLFEVFEGFIGDAVIGFYDPKQHVLVLRAAALTPFARTTLAHELTHALDDQWFDLERPALDKAGAGEAAGAFSALAEGNAVRVEDAYRATMSRADQDAAALEEAQLASSMNIDFTKLPPVIPEIVGFPYEAGPRFVRALVAAGGERRVDAAFRRPPTTTDEIVDPAAWLAGRKPIAVAQPKAGGKVIDHGVYGYSSLLVTLEPVVGTGKAERAAGGWGGDAFVAWDAGAGKTCVRAMFAMDTPADLAQLTESLQRWTTIRKATLDRSPGRVGFTSCR